jgi:hypothetical protein
VMARVTFGGLSLLVLLVCGVLWLAVGPVR